MISLGGPALPPPGRRPPDSNRKPPAAPAYQPPCWRPSPRRPSRSHPLEVRLAAAPVSGPSSRLSRSLLSLITLSRKRFGYQVAGFRKRDRVSGRDSDVAGRIIGTRRAF